MVRPCRNDSVSIAIIWSVETGHRDRVWEEANVRLENPAEVEVDLDQVAVYEGSDGVAIAVVWRKKLLCRQSRPGKQRSRPGRAPGQGYRTLQRDYHPVRQRLHAGRNRPMKRRMRLRRSHRTPRVERPLEPQTSQAGSRGFVSSGRRSRCLHSRPSGQSVLATVKMVPHGVITIVMKPPTSQWSKGPRLRGW